MKKKQPTKETNATEPEKTYLPFYMLLDHLKSAPREAFIPCYIESRFSQLVGGVDTVICKLSLFEPHSDNTVCIPEHFTIMESALYTWGHKVADWFVQSACQHCKTPNDSPAAELTQLLVTALSKDGATVPAMSSSETYELIYEVLADPSRLAVKL